VWSDEGPVDHRQYPILFVDDEGLLDTLQRRYDRDFTVRVANGSREALRSWRTRHRGVMADQRMPDMTGLELIKCARRVPT
jgi:CheY-like chemotaxis protein